MNALRRHAVDTATLRMTDGTVIEVKVLEGGQGPLIRVVTRRPLSLVGLWPAGGGNESTVEIGIH